MPRVGRAADSSLKNAVLGRLQPALARSKLASGSGKQTVACLLSVALHPWIGWHSVFQRTANLALAALALLPVLVWAQRDAGNFPLAEMPPFPKDADLVRQPADPGDTVRIFVDRTSIRLQENETQLAYVVEASSGVRSVFLEGFRCAGRSYTTYAIGSGQGTWSRIDAPSWQTASRVNANNARAKLLDDGYLCGRFWEQLPAAEVRSRLGRTIEQASP
jgi:hypothetical protein